MCGQGGAERARRPGGRGDVTWMRINMRGDPSEHGDRGLGELVLRLRDGVEGALLEEDSETDGEHLYVRQTDTLIPQLRAVGAAVRVHTLMHMQTLMRPHMMHNKDIQSTLLDVRVPCREHALLKSMKHKYEYWQH